MSQDFLDESTTTLQTSPQAAPAKAGDKVTLSLADLTALIQGISEASSEKMNKALETLSSAILESRKPYVSDAQKANEEAFRASTRKQMERLKENLKRDQATCEHIRGSNHLSSYPDYRGLSSIIWHVLDTTELFGICTNCQRQFRSNDPDYRQQLARKSGNVRSASGQRWFENPVEAIEAGRG